MKMNKNRILSKLTQQARLALDELICLQEVDSTNNYLLSQINFNNPKRLACFADQQVAGKGRRQRSWIGYPDHNIYHSFLDYLEPIPQNLINLSLAMGVVVARTLKALGITTGLKLKWPNDVLWHSKKLAGILVETAIRPNKACAVVIGIGINTYLPRIENQPIMATDAILKTKTDRNILAAELLNQLIPAIIEYQERGLKSFLNEWRFLDSFTGEMVRLNDNQQQITGLMRGISDLGELMLEDARGNVTLHTIGEVSLRKLSSISKDSQTESNLNTA